MAWYYRNLPNKKKIEWATNGSFYCPAETEAIKKSREDGEHHFTDRTKHDEVLTTGGWHVERDEPIKLELPNGDFEITSRRVHKKVTKTRKDLKCKCGLTMEFVGYPAKLTKTIKEGKTVGGLFTMGGEERILKYRYFKKRTAQKTWVNNQ